MELGLEGVSWCWGAWDCGSPFRWRPGVRETAAAGLEVLDAEAPSAGDGLFAVGDQGTASGSADGDTGLHLLAVELGDAYETALSSLSFGCDELRIPAV